MRLTPLIAWTASSIGSTTSRSTMPGDAPGYGMATETTGGATSGNSSVLSCHSAAMPNTTSAIITTVVITGLRIAKSEISMLARGGRDDLGAGCGRGAGAGEHAVAGAQAGDQD